MSSETVEASPPRPVRESIAAGFLASQKRKAARIASTMIAIFGVFTVSSLHALC